MTSVNFAYWLQGFFEIQNPETIYTKQVDMIKRHLSLVFIHEIDPSMGGQEHQDKLNEVHKPTLEELGEQHGFDVQSGTQNLHGACPFPGWKLSSIHGWYDPKEGVPRC